VPKEGMLESLVAAAQGVKGMFSDNETVASPLKFYSPQVANDNHPPTRVSDNHSKEIAETLDSLKRLQQEANKTLRGINESVQQTA